MSNKLAPIVIPVIVDAAGIDRGMRTAKQKLSSGLGGQGGTDFGGAAGFGSGTRGGGGSFASRALSTAVGGYLASGLSAKAARENVDRRLHVLNKQRSEMRPVDALAKSVYKQAPRAAWNVVKNDYATMWEKAKGVGQVVGGVATLAKSQVGYHLAAAKENASLKMKGALMDIGPGTLAGWGAAGATAAVAGVTALGSFRNSLANGTSGLQHLGAPDSSLNQTAMAIQRSQQSQPTDKGGFVARAASVAGTSTTKFMDAVGTGIGSLFSAETLGGMGAVIAAPFNDDTYMGKGGINERYGDFLSQQYKDWHTRSYGTSADMLASRKAARRANRLAEKSFIS